MKKILLFILFVLILTNSCGPINIYELPEQVPSFRELGINVNDFNTTNKIIIYVETNIKTIVKDTQCGTMPWDLMKYRKGDILDKCLLVAWMCEEAGIISDSMIISGGKSYSNRVWFVADGLENPIYNHDESIINIYETRSVNSILYDFSQNQCSLMVIERRENESR